MRYCLVLIVGVSLTLAASLARAQELSKEAKVERILQLTNADAMMDQVFNQMKAMATSQVPKGTTPEQQAREEQTRSKVMDLIKARMQWDKMRPHYVKLYSETFSDEEISGMLAFYESPAGRAMLAKMPVLMGKTMSLVQAQMADVMPEIERITKEAQQANRPK